MYLTCAALLLLGVTIATHPDRPRSVGVSCNAATFSSLGLANINVLQLDAAPSYNLSSTASSYDACIISLRYTHPGQNDIVNSWIGLPLNASRWNSRFVMNGGSGWTAGAEANIYSSVADGYVSSSTDGGHNATTTQEQWGLVSEGNVNWPNLWDFSAVALAEAVQLGQLASEVYFGSPPKYSYWNGCSTGGRQGHMMAQRYPYLFDGIAAGAPAINWDRFQLQQVWSDFKSQELDIAPPSCVLEAFTAAAIAACDELDGLKDGIISYPGQCHFDGKSIINQIVNCSEPTGEVTITYKHAELVNAIWQGPTSAEGHFQWYGLHYDSQLTGLLQTSCTTVDNCTIVPFSIGLDWLTTFLAKNTSYGLGNLTRKDFDRFYRQSVHDYKSIIGTDDAELTDLKLSGAKVIAWHGMADQLIPTNGTVDYYTRIALANTNISDFYRFYLAPGSAHCGDGPGVNPLSTVLGTLEAWVENGTVPETLPATGPAIGPSDTSSIRTIGLCQYPLVQTYIGPDPNSASSFTCQ